MFFNFVKEINRLRNEINRLLSKVMWVFLMDMWGNCIYVPWHSGNYRVNAHSVVAWMSRNSLLEAGAKFEGQVTATGLEPRTN